MVSENANSQWSWISRQRLFKGDCGLWSDHRVANARPDDGIEQPRRISNGMRNRQFDAEAGFCAVRTCRDQTLRRLQTD